MNINELEAAVHLCISRDEIEAALRLLMDYFEDDDTLNDLVLQSGALEAIKNAHLRGILPFDEFNDEKNVLRANILQLVKREKIQSQNAQSTENADSDKAEKTAFEAFKKSLIFSSVFTVLAVEDEDGTIWTLTQIETVVQIPRCRKYVREACEMLARHGLIDKIRKERSTFYQINANGLAFFKAHKRD